MNSFAQYLNQAIIKYMPAHRLPKYKYVNKNLPMNHWNTFCKYHLGLDYKIVTIPLNDHHWVCYEAYLIRNKIYKRKREFY